MFDQPIGSDRELLRKRKSQAERYFRGVYAGNPSVIDELADEDVVITYPIFQQISGKDAFRGREEAKAFSARFSSKWADAEITIDQIIAEKQTVVLVWSFAARDTTSPAKEKQRWGGITLFRFNPDGKIVAECGEESSPGPISRLHGPVKPGGD